MEVLKTALTQLRTIIVVIPNNLMTYYLVDYVLSSIVRGSDFESV